MKAWWFRFWVWVSLCLGVYYWWSRIYQRVVERAWFKCGPLPEYDSLVELEQFLGEVEWRRDGMLTLGDAIGSPTAFYWRHVLGHDDHKLMGNDCDEFGLYAADRMRDMTLRGILGGWGIHERYIYLLTVVWLRDGWSGGHNVCLYRYVEPNGDVRWAHLGNWNNGRSVVGFVSIEAVVADILQGGGADECVGWALATPKLKRVRYRDGRGIEL